MPKPLQTAVVDRPWLDSLPVDLATAVSRVLEALDAPLDDTATRWVLCNLAHCLKSLLPECHRQSKTWLSAEADLAERASTSLSAELDPPKLELHADKITLYSCLAALDPERSPSKLLQLLGGIYCLRVTGGKPASESAMELLLRACVVTRPDTGSVNAAVAAALIACSRQLNMARDQLSSMAIGRRSAATSMIEAKVEKRFRGDYLFDTTMKLEGAVAPRGLTPSDVRDAGPKLREAAQAGSAGALLAALAHWHGVMPVDMPVLPIFSPAAGLMRTDPSTSFTAIKLGGILTELARTELAGVLATGDALYLPWPRWISEVVRQLREANPLAQSIADLPGMPSGAKEHRQLLSGLNLPRRITASKLVVDRAQPLLRSEVDPILCALACLDFSRIHKVSAAYEHVRSSELLAVLKHRAEVLGWGELSLSPVVSSGHLSAVTPELEQLRLVGSRLFNEVMASYTGPNAGPRAVFALHNAFIRYTAFLLAAGLALRGQERTLLPASLLRVHAMHGEFDKVLPHASSSPADLVLGATLQLQLRYVGAHYQALIDRLRKGLARYSPHFPRIAAELAHIVDGKSASPLLVTVKGEQLKTFSLLDLVDYLGADWPGKADGLRHVVPLILRAHGTAYDTREAALRHVGGSKSIASGTSAWSRGDWHREASKLQDLVLGELSVRPAGGLVRSLGRRA